jgi:hypothetical protein
MPKNCTVLERMVSKYTRRRFFHSRKYIVQGDISKSCNCSDTEVCCYIGIELVYEVLRFTETTNFCKICAIEITTTFELEEVEVVIWRKLNKATDLILKYQPRGRSCGEPQFMEIGPFFQSEEPNEGADDKNADSIYQ